MTRTASLCSMLLLLISKAQLTQSAGPASSASLRNLISLISASLLTLYKTIVKLEHISLSTQLIF